MDQVAATQFPTLHCYNEACAAPGTSNRRHSFHHISGMIQTRIQSIHDTLETFAGFILELTGDDDVAFDLITYSDTAAPEHGSVFTTHSSFASKDKAPVQQEQDGSSFAITKLLRQNHECSQSDFAFVFHKQSSNYDFDEAFPGKPFVVVLGQDGSFRLRISSTLAPDALRASIFKSFTMSMGWCKDTDVEIPCLARPYQSLSCHERSVLNHPPMDHPPDFEALLDLKQRPEAYQQPLLHNAFLLRARDHPERVAVDALTPRGQIQYTYRTVDYLSNTLANKILTHVTDTQRNITVALDTSVELYIAWLGVLKAGCVFSPVPTNAPPELLRHMTRTTSSKLVLGTTDTLIYFKEALGSDSDCAVINVETLIVQAREDHHVESLLASPTQTDKDDVAYILFTSGSTGLPKGVQITHHAAVASVAAHIAGSLPSFELGSSRVRWFQFAAPTFDPSVLEIFLTLSIGGTLCASDRAMTLSDPEAVIARLEATHTFTTPSLASLIRPEKVPLLRDLWVVGETLKQQVSTSFARDRTLPAGHPRTRLWNFYGPTEASISVTVSSVSVRQRCSIIGVPLSTCSIVILDTTNPPAAVPLGFAGELAIGGPQLSTGYLNSPGKTAASFVCVSPYGRLYRTGDRARLVMGPGGKLLVEFLGRMSSDQIKISGKRVELGEIEAGLSNELVAEVAAVALKLPGEAGDGVSGTIELIALVVPREEAEAQDILGVCHQRAESVLQPHMRPSRYYLIKELPRLVSGKLDRKSLSESCHSPDKAGMKLLVSPIVDDLPYTEDDVQSVPDFVLEIISSVAVFKPAIATSATTLLSLGLDSLHSVKLLQALRQEGVNGLQITDILACRTLGDLSRKIEKVASGKDVLNSSSLSTSSTIIAAFAERHKENCLRDLVVDAHDVELVLPATTSQAVTLSSYLLTADATVSSAKAYINHTAYHIKSNQDAAQVVLSWVSVLARHDIMRTVFVQVDDDLTPFAQCVLRHSHQDAAVVPRLYHADDDHTLDGAVNKAQKDAEDAIVLNKPPRCLSVVKSPARTIIILSTLHSIFDGGSLSLIMEDVEREYLGKPIIERTGILTAVQRHFSEARDVTARFWSQYLEGSNSPSFPCLRSTLPKPDEAGYGICSFVSDLSLASLNAQAARMHASTLAILQTAWAKLLYLYTGDRDIVFGNVVSDRFTDELQNCSAPVLTVHPVRVRLEEDVDSGPPHLDMIRYRTKESPTSLVHLHTVLTGARYDTTFAFQMFLNGGGEDLLYDMIATPAMENDQAVMIEVYQHKSGVLEFRATYQTRLLDDTAASLMLEGLASTTRWIMSNPEKPFLSSPTVDRKYIEPKSDRLGQKLLHECIHDNALAYPNAIALAFYNDTTSFPALQLTYAELNAKANKIASFLSCSLGDKPTKHVIPICMEKCPELYVTIAGILKAGAAWCPVDPTYPKARQSLLIEKTSAGIVCSSYLTDALLASWLPSQYKSINTQELLNLDNNNSTNSSYEHTGDQNNKDSYNSSDGNIPSAQSQCVESTDTAYVIFTSGTTGEPKAVPISHGAASLAIDSFLEYTSIQGLKHTQIRYMQFANFTFDVFGRDVFAAWKLGATLISAPRSVLLSEFTELANHAKATHASMTPTFASTLQPQCLTTLQWVSMGGEALPQPLADEWKSRVSLCNVYGPAETAMNASVNRISTRSRSINIGRALPCVGAWVIDSTGRPLITHALGELVLAGPQLSEGYWQDPERDKGKFEWSNTFQCRLYHTGDYVRQLSDGSFDFVGRRDDLVKIRGMRVELKEISRVCTTGQKSVRHSEVLLIKLPGSSEVSLICFVDCGLESTERASDAWEILDDDAAHATVKNLKQHIISQLPSHMVPDVFIPLASLPRNQSSKVDRKRLEEIVTTQWSPQPPMDACGQQDDPAWLSTNDQLLVRIKDVAKVAPSSWSAQTTLSEIGVDSIGAIRLSARLKSDGYNISAVKVLESKTIGDLVSHASSKDDKTSNWQARLKSFEDDWLTVVAQRLHRDPAQLTVAPSTTFQDGMLVETLRDPSLYWGNFLWELPERVDVESLRQAWEYVAHSHEILRVGFVHTAALDPDQLNTLSSSSTIPMFIQVIDKEARPKWQELTCQAETLEEYTQELCEEFARTQHEAHFSTPPWQVSVVSQGNARFMLLAIHHSLYDGDSLHYLMEDVANAYTLRRSLVERCQVGEAVTRLSSRDMDETSTRFWESALSTFAAGEESYGTASDNPVAKTKTISHRTIEMGATLPTSQLNKVARRLGATSLSPLFRVVFGAMLAEHEELESVLFGEVRSERLFDSRLVGAMAPLSSVYPVPFTPSGSFSLLVEAQQTFITQGIRYGPPKASEVRKLLCKSRHDGLYSAMFVLHPLPQGSDPDLLPWKQLRDGADILVDHKFALNVFEMIDDTVLISLSVDEAIMSRDAQRLFVLQIDALLTAFSKAPQDTPIAGLSNYLPVELVSVAASGATAEYPPSVSPSFYIEKWAEIHPDWKAVEVATHFTEDRLATAHWTYKQFNDLANQVAHLVLDLGVHQQSVAVSLDRSLMAFAVIIGIIKSGNTYVPIDSSLPNDRKAFMVRDSNVALAFVCDDSFAQVELPSHILVLDISTESFTQPLSKKSTAPLTNLFSPTQNAYILYTSGSTGKPKGVQVSRQNLSIFNDAWGEFIGNAAPATLNLGGVGKFLCLASRAFDVHIGEMFLAWRFGLCATTGDRLSMLDDLPRTLKDLNVTHVGIVPSLLDQVGLTPEDAPDLVYLAVGGEKMTARTQQIWSSSDRVALANVYGPTEATVGICAGRIWPESDPRCIGKPLGDSVAHVLVPGTDEHAKKGMPGELIFEGSLIANGYLNRPDAKGFCMMNGQRAYRTGDIVRMMPDNSILFLGRKDEQVKVRGQRLELGEVSEVVRTASRKNIDAATLLLRHPDLPKQFLVTFVAPKGADIHTIQPDFVVEDFRPTNKELRMLCVEILPVYMVPDFIIPVSFIPLRDTSAKTDAKLLENMFQAISLTELFDESSVDTDTAHIQQARSLTPLEENIVQAVEATVAQHNRLIATPSSTLFQLGVDSIAAVQLSFRLKQIGLNVSVARLLQNPTVESLGDGSFSSPNRLDAPSRDTVNDFDDLEKTCRKLLRMQDAELERRIEVIRPCLPLQEILVAHSMSHGVQDNNEYVSHMLFDVVPGTDSALLKAAWNTVVQSHELLRTCFMDRGDNILQLVQNSECTPSWTSMNTNHYEVEKDLVRRKKAVSDDIINNIRHTPPLRLTFIAADLQGNLSGSIKLMLSIHHALYDMESIKMIVGDFERAYQGESLLIRPSILNLLRYIVQQQQDKDAVKRHWSSQFTGYTPRVENTPPQRPQLAARTLRMDLEAMEKLCAKMDTTLSVVSQTVFAYALCQKLGVPDIVIGVVLSGRSIDVAGIHEMAAPCISTIPQRVHLKHDGATLEELIKSVQTRLFTSMRYQYTSLRDLSKWMGVSGPLFTGLFSFTKKLLVKKTSVGERRVLQHTQGDMSLNFGLALECEADPNDNNITLQARSTVFKEADELAALLRQMELLIDSLASGKSVKIENIFSNESEARIKQSKESKKATEEEEWSTLEQQLRELIVEFSNSQVKDVKKTTPFIKYGIDSISTIRFSKMLRAHGIRVSGADVLANPSIANLARYIGASKFQSSTNGETRADNTAVPTTRWSKDILKGIVQDSSLDNISIVYPVTPLQAGMISATIMEDPTLYSHHHSLRLSRDVDLPKLKSSWEALVSMHDILRTSFYQVNPLKNQLVGAVLENASPDWQLVPSQDVKKVFMQLVTDTKFTGIDSFARPPVRATVIRSPEEQVFIVSLHHAVYDGVSIRFIFQDLWSLYHDLPTACRPPFNQMALRIHELAPGSVPHWVDSLSGYSGAPALVDDQDLQCSVSSHLIELTDKLSALEARYLDEGITVQVICQLLVGKAVCAMTRSRDVVLGQVHAARLNLSGAEEVAGPMMNTVPLRVNLFDEYQSNDQYLHELQQAHTKALHHIHAPLSDIQQAWRENNDTEGQLFEVLFVFRKGEDTAESIAWEPYLGDNANNVPPPSQYALVIEAHQSSSGSLQLQIYSKLPKHKTSQVNELLKKSFDDVWRNPNAKAVHFLRALALPPAPTERYAADTLTESTFDPQALNMFFGSLVQAVAKVTGCNVATVAPTTSIFSLGVDSIAAIRVANTCRKSNISLSTIDIVRNPKLGRLCEVAFANKVKGGAPAMRSDSSKATLVDSHIRAAVLEKLKLAEDEVEGILPLLPGQEYYLAQWLRSGKTLYENTFVFQAKEPLDVDRLRWTWAALIRNNACLRTCFAFIRPELLVQVVLKPDSMKQLCSNFAVEQLPNGISLKDLVTGLVHDAYHSPSSLREPPIRLTIIKGGIEGDAVLLTLHHAIYDAWSMRLLLSQLIGLYREPSFKLQTQPSLSDLVQASQARVKNIDERQYWQGLLLRCESTIIKPTLANGSSATTTTCRRTFFSTTCHGITVAALTSAAHSIDVTPQSLIQVAFGQMLSEVTGSKSPVFGHFVSGRSLEVEGLENMTFPTLNMLPISIPSQLIRSDSSAEHIVNRLRSYQQDAITRTAYDQSSLRDVIRWANELGVSPLFNAHLNILWNDEDMSFKSPSPNKAFLTPWPLGTPSDYASNRAIVKDSTVDGFDTSFLPASFAGTTLTADIGLSEDRAHFSIGIGCDASLRDVRGLEDIVQIFLQRLLQLIQAICETSEHTETN